MKARYTIANRTWHGAICAIALFLATATVAAAQQPAPLPLHLRAPSLRLLSKARSGDRESLPSADAKTSSPSQGNENSKSASRITPEQAKQLFAMVDELIKFSSDETGLPIKSTVKRQLTTRAAVEAYLDQKFNEDEGAKRLQRDEIVLKKFGLIDQDFELKPFLLALLKEQIEGYYDSKTKTVNLLDWVDPEEQKPVMAHELTHALQDQHSDLEKWDDQTPSDVSTSAAGDQNNLAKDEMDTARDAVAEGQATAVMFDYMLKPMGKSLIKDPEVLDIVKSQMNTAEDSPVMARAPLLLSETILFPYREGLSFEQDVWMDQGQAAAFAGTLDRPPTSSWEIINPREYEKKHIPAIPLLPDIHPLVDPLYRPYDIGQMGELDVHIITELFGGDNAARDLTPAWDGGFYWAGQLRTPAEQATTKSLAIFYLSVWRNADSAQVFTKLYANNLARKYSSVQLQTAASPSSPADDGTVEQVYSTNEGPVVITTRGKLVFAAESFPLPLARKLTALILDAQGGGAMRMANAPVQFPAPVIQSEGRLAAGAEGPAVGLPLTKAGNQDPVVSSRNHEPPSPLPSPPKILGAPDKPGGALSGDLVRFFESCGVMKVAIDAELRAAGR
jgi:hypothetical protein